MKLLDLFCGGGGAGMGYFRASFSVTGVDCKAQPKYPFAFVKADAFEYLQQHGHEYDLIHASPVCKRYSTITKTAGTQDNHPDQIPGIRQLLNEIGKPYVIENVPGSPLVDPVTLCGTMFGLRITRHRMFECSLPVQMPLPCIHEMKVVKHGRRPNRETQYAAATGHFSDVAYVQRAMDIDWLGQSGLSQAIPPAYTEYIGYAMKRMMR